MKKKLVAGFALFAVFSMVYAHNAYAASASVGDADITFCNGNNKLSLTLDANTTTGFCMQVDNLSNSPITVRMAFADGEMSAGNPPTQACKTSADGIFGKAVTLEGESSFTLKGGERIIKTGNITLPQGFAGELYGCITYFVGSNSGEKQGMFSILTRKANTIAITVSGNVSSILDIGQLQGTRNGDGSYTIKYALHNKGFSTEKITSTVTVKSNLGYNKTYTLADGLDIYGGESKEYTQQTSVLPWYGGKFTVTSTVTYQPYVNNQPHGDKQQKADSITFAYGIGKYGQVPLGAAILIVLGLLWALLKKNSRKKHHTKHHDHIETKITPPPAQTPHSSQPLKTDKDDVIRKKRAAMKKGGR